MLGTIKWYNSQKGYGFIQPNDGSKDVFLHATALERSNIASVFEGQEFEYELGRPNPAKDGKVAVHTLKAPRKAA